MEHIEALIEKGLFTEACYIASPGTASCSTEKQVLLPKPDVLGLHQHMPTVGLGQVSCSLSPLKFNFYPALDLNASPCHFIYYKDDYLRYHMDVATYFLSYF